MRNSRIARHAARLVALQHKIRYLVVLPEKTLGGERENGFRKRRTLC